MSSSSAVVGIAACLLAAVAWPCSGPVCEQFFVSVPRQGATIPANAPAVGVQRALFGVDSPDGGTQLLSPTVQAVTLRSTDGGAVNVTPLTATFGVFGTASGLTAGSEYEVALAEGARGCPALTGRFPVGPVAPIPTTSATIVELDSEWFDGGPTCAGDSPQTQLTRLRITPTSEMEPWLPLARWDLELDGRLVAAAPYGDLGAGPFERQALAAPAFLPINIVPVVCSGPGAIARGLHQVRLQARIEGLSAPITSNTLTVQVDCAASPPRDAGVVAPRDAGLQGLDASVDAGDAGGSPTTPDAGIDGGREAGVDAGPIVIDGGSGVVSGPVPPAGCAVSPAAAALMLVVVPLLLRAQRRRRG